MPEKVEYFIKRVRKRRKYFERYLDYCKLIKNKVCKRFGPVRVIVFGSILRGDYNLALSDIDVLIITPIEASSSQRAKIISYVKNDVLKDPAAPFEIHIVSEEEYREWYKRFIDVELEVQ